MNDTTVKLLWDKPFTWEEFPILNYIVFGMNSSNGEVLVNATTEARKIAFTRREGCSVLKFEVKAVSAVGESIPTTLLWAIPISESSYY